MTSSSDPAALQQAQAKFLEGWAHHQRGQIGQAWGLYQEVLALAPRHFDALHLAGIIAAQARHFEEAVDLMGRALAVDPDNAAALYNRGNAQLEMGRPQDAIESFDKAIRLDPAQAAEPYNQRGNALWTLRRPQEALESFDKALQLHPNFAEAHNNRGNALRDLKQSDAALASYDKAIAINSGYADAYYNRGVILRALKRFADAIASYDRVIALKPTYAEAYSSRGLALASLKQFEAAIADYNQAIAAKPDYAEAYNNRGLALGELRRYDDALASYDAAIRIKPDYSEAYSNSGVALKDAGQLEAALVCYDKAIELKPASAEAHYNRGVVLNDMKRYAEAVAAYSRALEINPAYAFLHGLRLYTKLNICDWRDFDAEVAKVLAEIARGESASPPFSLLMLTDAPVPLRKTAEIWAREEQPPSCVLGPMPKRAPSEKSSEKRAAKIRVGYFSMDFHNHPVSQLLAGVIEAHDRDKFEAVAFSYGPDTQDDMRRRIKQAFDQFIDVREQSDLEIAALARRMEIDIAVDLAGYTGQPRTGVFALGAAPLQVNFLGYPGTMGAAYYDYLIADRIVIPDSAKPYYAERIVHMPHCYQPNDTKRAVSDRMVARAELGLPPRGFVFCCFNNNLKISPATYDSWMRILGRVPGSVLWLLEDNPAAAANLRVEAQRRGIDPARLVFAPRMPFGDNLARQRAADLFLDTLPYNAHTTASDALWVGLPVLTCTGASFAARVAASILTAAGLPELITGTRAAFEDKAVGLASDGPAYARLKKKLADARATAPLFNAALYARHIEDAYSQMQSRSEAGLSPAHLSVPALDN